MTCHGHLTEAEAKKPRRLGLNFNFSFNKCRFYNQCGDPTSATCLSSGNNSYCGRYRQKIMALKPKGGKT